MNLYLSTGIPVIGMVKTSDSPSSSVSNVYFYRCHEVGGGSELMVRVVPTPATGALVYLFAAVLITYIPRCNAATSPLLERGSWRVADALAWEIEQTAVKNSRLGALLQSVCG